MDSMNRRPNGWLWTTASLIACVGIGTVMYFITGDDVDNEMEASYEKSDRKLTMSGNPLEYDDIYTAQETVENQSRFEVQEDGNEDGYSSYQNTQSIDNKLDQILILLGKQNVTTTNTTLSVESPAWATELICLTKELSDEVKSLRAVRTNHSIEEEEAAVSTSSTNTELSIVQSTVQSTPINQKDRLKALKTSIESILRSNIKSNNKEDSLGNMRKCFNAMSMYFSNLVDHPTVQRYRKVSTLNPTFKSNVLPYDGYHEIFCHVGFVLKGTTYEWTWGSDTTKKTVGDGISEEDKNVILKECLSILNSLKSKSMEEILDDLSQKTYDSIQSESTFIPSSSSSSSETTSITPIVTPIPTMTSIPKFEEIFRQVKHAKETPDETSVASTIVTEKETVESRLAGEI